ncbi:MAG: ATP-dependent helicase HrpB [Acidobacteriota bacterium]
MSPKRPPPSAPLPIDGVLPEILGHLQDGSSLVLRAPTGAGKTTRVPPALLDAGLGAVWMVQPRRLAARAAARRIADERGAKLGAEVGYRVRFDHRAGADSRLVVMTEGILLQRLQADPFLEGVGALIFDEFHERRLDSDLALALARRVQCEIRPELRLVVMSATLDPQPITTFLGDCPAVESEGFLHPVAVEYDTGTDELSPSPREIAARTARAIRRVLADDPNGGDVLAFLPGVGEIERTRGHLADLPSVDLVPLFGNLSPRDQDRALRAGPLRRVVLATNVAETSVTVEGITTVVDSGWARQLRFDPATGLNRLELVRISRAAADQRTGRAGRLGPGRCLRLWSEHDQRGRRERDAPEVRRIDLSGPVLQLLAWGEPDPAGFPWFEAPRSSSVGQALELLGQLGAHSAIGLTALGRRMAKLPLSPRLAALLITAERGGCGRRGALAAALLAERSPFARGARAAALLPRLEALEDFAEGGSVPSAGFRPGAARYLLQVRDQLCRTLSQDESEVEGAGSQPSSPTGREADALRRALLAAFPDRLTAVRRASPGAARGRRVGGRAVEIEDHVPQGLILALEVQSRAGRDDRLWLYEPIPEGLIDARLIDEQERVAWDAEAGRARAFRQRLFLGLPLSEVEIAVTPEQAQEALVTTVRDDLTGSLGLDRDPLESFLARWACLRRWRPELDLPAIDEGFWEPLLPSLCQGCRDLGAVARRPILDILRGALPFDAMTVLDREVPARIEVPSGRRAAIRYRVDEPPILEARIQELFGWHETPTVAAGRVPLLLHLLAPNFRPQQVTRDLAGFWNSTYAEVRKELQGRYPKHAWPADPWSAEATPIRRRRSSR